MLPDDAWRLLGLEPTDDADELRRAFLSAIRGSHPDVTVAGSGADPALVTEAYRVVRLHLGRREEALTPPTPPPRAPAPPAEPTRVPAPPTDAPAPSVDQRDADLLTVSAPPSATFALVVEALDDVGDVTFIDRSSGLAQALVTFVEGPVCYLHLAVTGRRSAGSSEVAVTVESLQADPAPPLEAVTALIADAVRRVSERPGTVG